MRKTKILFLLSFLFCILQTNAQDWRNYLDHTNFKKYQEANEKLSPLAPDDVRVVFMGNSITEAWPVIRPDFFKDANYIGRGISGQTTPQMLLRFRKDVINLQPEVVVLLAGINDIAGNTGFTPIELIAENIMSMVELAQQNNIKVVLCSVLPAIDFPWNPGLEPVNKVIELNKMIQTYAVQNNIPYVDYHTAMKDENNGLKVPEFTTADDLVHPNEAGYIVMEKLVQPAIEEVLAQSKFSVSSLFSNHVVLQQKENVAIWGIGRGGEKVKVVGSWGSEATTNVDEKGNWQLKLKTPEAGGPYQLNIISSKNNIQIKDVMIGEVWLASGQSNMEMPLKGWPPRDPIANSTEEIANAKYPQIRMFDVPNIYDSKERTSVNGNWEICSSETAANFSASAYFFARRLHQELKIPIGIINSTWGGTPAESWTSKTQLKTLGDFDNVIAAIENPERERQTNEWYDRWKKMDIPNDAKGWDNIDLNDLFLAVPNFDDSNWETIKLPGRIDFQNEQDLNGAFWVRKKIEINDVSSDYTFNSGPVDDTDAVFFNGKKIGGKVNSYDVDRKYTIPKSLLKKGKNTIAIRIIDTGGPGSINGEMQLTNGKETISIEGNWKYIFSAEMYQDKIYIYDLEKVKTLKRPNVLVVNAWTPSSLYNAMIHPLVPYNIKGAIWYQGESNVGRAEQYRRLFPAMIKNWRQQWSDNFPFYFVQIAPFNYQNSLNPMLDESQKIRDAQRHTLSLEKTGMVVTLDIGDNENIHPANKQDVGKRLAGLALANDYGENIIASGPIFKSHRIKRKKIFLEFDYTGSGLKAKNSKLVGFEIAGADKKFVAADAKIVGSKIKVCAKGISYPKYVRYAWRDISEASLFNKEGLPASSFTTED